MTVKEMRTETGMTQQAFADLLGIPKRSIQNWEYEKSDTPAYLLRLIEYYLTHEGYIKKTE